MYQIDFTELIGDDAKHFSDLLKVMEFSKDDMIVAVACVSTDEPLTPHQISDKLIEVCTEHKIPACITMVMKGSNVFTFDVETEKTHIYGELGKFAQLVTDVHTCELSYGQCALPITTE